MRVRRPFCLSLALLGLIVVPSSLHAPAANAGYQDDGLVVELASGPNAGLEVPADEPYWTIPVWSQPGGTMQGPVVYGGYGCAADRASLPAPEAVGPLAAGERAIIVLQRGPTSDPDQPGAGCLLGEKVESAMLAGFDGVLVVNNHAGSTGTGTGDTVYCDPPGKDFAPTVTAACVGHRAMHLFFDTEPTYNGGSGGQHEPKLGQVGQRLLATSQGLPIKYSRHVDGPGWASFAVSSPGGLVKFPLRLDAEEAPGQLNAFLYSANDEFLGGFGFGVFRSEISHWESVKAGPIEFHGGEVVQRDRSGMMSMIGEVRTEGPATFKMLVWGGGRRVASWQTAVRGQGIQILGVETGSSVVVAMAKEFDAPANVDAHAIAGGRATVLGERVVEVNDTLIGSFSQMTMTASHQPPWTGVNANLISTTTPAGETLCHPFGCGFSAASGPTRAGPGTYRFKLSGGGLGLTGSDDVMLNVVDARLPALPRPG